VASKPKSPESGRETVPMQFPEVPPPAYGQTIGILHLVESMMQMQQAIGELKANVIHLKDASNKQTAKLDRISHIIFAAGVVLAIVLAIGGFFLNKIWDGVFTLLKAAH
jgi:hypothetical protein